MKLSGGQRQRIAIARVILENAPVLVLDEATSSLDSITEQHIQSALDEAMGGKTVLVIAHRLSTIAHLDRVRVFSKGEIVEDGSHAALLQRRGAYYRAWSRQVHGVLPGVERDDVLSPDTSSRSGASDGVRSDGFVAPADVPGAGATKTPAGG